MELEEAKRELNKSGLTIDEGYSKDKFIISGIFDCEGTMKKLYYYRSSENWTDDIYEATEFVAYPVQNLMKAKTVCTEGTKNTLGCPTAKLDHIEVLQVKTMGTGYRKTIKLIGKTPVKINEDFGIGVGAPLGADQGIPCGGDCKAVVAKRMDGGRPHCRFDLRRKKKKKAKK